MFLPAFCHLNCHFTQFLTRKKQRETSNFQCSLFSSMTCKLKSTCLTYMFSQYAICLPTRRWFTSREKKTHNVNCKLYQMYRPTAMFDSLCVNFLEFSKLHIPVVLPVFSPMLTFLGGTGRQDFFSLQGWLYFDERVLSQSLVRSFVHSFISHLCSQRSFIQFTSSI